VLAASRCVVFSAFFGGIALAGGWMPGPLHPGPRCYSPMVYDTARGRLVLSVVTSARHQRQ